MGVHYNKADFITYGKPSLFLDFANKKSLTDRISGNNLITFTRSSTGTYVGADGLIKTAAADEARFDHDPVTGESLGLLIEERRTNLVKSSNNFSDWSESNITIGSSSLVSPDGTTNAALLTTTQTGINYPFTGLFSTQSNNTYTFSVWTKFEISFSILMYGSGFGVLLLFDSATKQPTTTTINSGTTGITGKVESYSNGWYRVSATTTSTGTNFGEATIALNKNKVTTWGLSNSSSIGDTLTVWGAQLEAGAFPTSYIPTSGSTVTRNADLAYISQANMQSWYNNTEGTIFSHSIGYRGVGGIAYFGSNTEGWGLFQNASFLTNKGRGSYTPDTANTSGVLSNTFRNIKAAISINDTTNLTSYYVNGSAIGNDKTRSGPFTYPIGFGLAQADVGGTSQVTHSLCLNKIVYYPTTLTNSQLQSRTE